MHGDIVRIEKLENGYEVEVCDPSAQEKNSLSKSLYVDPWKGYAFSTKEEVIKFLTKVLDKLAPKDESAEFADSFSEAVSKKE